MAICDCQNETVVTGDNLRRGHTLSTTSILRAISPRRYRGRGWRNATPSICHSPSILEGVRRGWYLYPPEYQAAFLVVCAVSGIRCRSHYVSLSSPVPAMGAVSFAQNPKRLGFFRYGDSHIGARSTLLTLWTTDRQRGNFQLPGGGQRGN